MLQLKELQKKGENKGLEQVENIKDVVAIRNHEREVVKQRRL